MKEGGYNMNKFIKRFMINKAKINNGIWRRENGN
ncbi:Uncharacterised protein [Clostridium paraputrificum]|uniref:Uncharacterized protein n=1 Tax=Clostridium paraputrificum TaxID=29363 RepID=A0A6N3F3Z1_9CLOT